MNKAQGKQIWDVVVVGGGPAGCSAAVVLARSMRKVLLLDDDKQRNLKSRGMHNYLTRDDILPGDYLSAAYDELKKYDITVIKSRAVKAKKLGDKGFEITDSHKQKYLCRRLLLATGVSDEIPDVPGMQELWGCCVFHCPHCDGWECRDKRIALYSKLHNGYGMALALRQLSEDVTLYTDGSRYLRPAQKAKLNARGIKVISTHIKELRQKDNQLTGITLTTGETIDSDCVFVNHNYYVNGQLLQQLDCNCSRKGAALTNRKQESNVKGVYVAGDASYDIHFVIVAAAEGVKAAVAIHNDLLKTDNP